MVCFSMPDTNGLRISWVPEAGLRNGGGRHWTRPMDRSEGGLSGDETEPDRTSDASVGD